MNKMSLALLLSSVVGLCPCVQANKQVYPLQAITAMSWKADGGALAWGETGGHIHLWSKGLKKQLSWRHDLFPVYDLAWSRDGNYLAAAGKHIDIYALTTSGQIKHIKTLNHTGLTAIAWAPTGKVLASAGSGSIRIWDITRARLLRTLVGVRCVAWSPDGRFLAGGINEGTAKIWHVATGKAMTFIGSRYKNVRAEVKRLVWSPNGRNILTESRFYDDHTTRIWNSGTGKQVRAMAKSLGVQWSRDGKQMAVFDTSGNMRVWDAGSGKLRRFLKLPRWATAVLSPNGRVVAIEASVGGNLALLNALTGQRIRTIRSVAPRGGIQDLSA